jgi:hypothetical protein
MYGRSVDSPPSTLSLHSFHRLQSPDAEGEFCIRGSLERIGENFLKRIVRRAADFSTR